MSSPFWSPYRLTIRPRRTGLSVSLSWDPFASEVAGNSVPFIAMKLLSRESVGDDWRYDWVPSHGSWELRFRSVQLVEWDHEKMCVVTQPLDAESEKGLDPWPFSFPTQEWMDTFRDIFTNWARNLSPAQISAEAARWAPTATSREPNELVLELVQRLQAPVDFSYR